ncbi:MAG: thioredoxin [Methanomicrobiales archaeon]|nr:thioredoxin [Methanomicrobiales archaeon]
MRNHEISDTVNSRPLSHSGIRHSTTFIKIPKRKVYGESMAKPVLIDFYADWCGPCRLQSPKLEELKKRMGDAIEIKKVDVDQHMDIADRYGITVVPTLIIEKNGKEIRRLEGLTDAGTLETILRPLVEK